MTDRIKSKAKWQSVAKKPVAPFGLPADGGDDILTAMNASGPICSKCGTPAVPTNVGYVCPTCDIDVSQTARTNSTVPVGEVRVVTDPSTWE